MGCTSHEGVEWGAPVMRVLAPVMRVLAPVLRVLEAIGSNGGGEGGYIVHNKV